MKFQAGDKIIVVATQEKGEVVEWIDKEMLLVDVDGIQFPVYKDQIDFPYFNEFNKPKLPVKVKQQIEHIPVEKKTVKEKIVDGVWLSFFPILDKDVFDDDIISHFKIYILNHTHDELTFDLSIYYADKKEMDLKKNLSAFEDIYLFDMPFEHLNDQPSFEFDFALQVTEKKRANHFEVKYKPKPKQFFKKAEELLKEQKAFFNVLLYDLYPEKPDEDEMDLAKLSSAGFKVYRAEKYKSHLPPARTLIDLHIEKLVDKHQGMDATSILGIQLNAFEKFYDQAILHHLPNIIVIHGVGKGVLKDELHELLRYKKEVKSFINKYDPNFGYGATEIYFN